MIIQSCAFVSSRLGFQQSSDRGYPSQLTRYETPVLVLSVNIEAVTAETVKERCRRGLWVVLFRVVGVLRCDETGGVVEGVLIELGFLIRLDLRGTTSFAGVEGLVSCGVSSVASGTGEDAAVERLVSLVDSDKRGDGDVDLDFLCRLDLRETFSLSGVALIVSVEEPSVDSGKEVEDDCRDRVR